MNEAYLFDGEKIWLDIPEPKVDEFIFTATANYALGKFNSRPSYPVSDELKLIWWIGQKVVEWVNFEIGVKVQKIRCHCPCHTNKHMIHCFPCCVNGFKEIKTRIAIPLPEQDEVKVMQQKFALHLGEKELNTTDAYAVEWTVKELSGVTKLGATSIENTTP